MFSELNSLKKNLKCLFLFSKTVWQADVEIIMLLNVCALMYITPLPLFTKQNVDYALISNIQTKETLELSTLFHYFIDFT